MGNTADQTIEHQYCEPVAEALAFNILFAKFFMERAGKETWAEEFVCLKQQQIKSRTKGTPFWWKHVFCHEKNCTCPKLRGGEIDILVVFERPDGQRLGLHIECKHPADFFHKGQQADEYRERLACWTLPNKGPRTTPRHGQAVSLLITNRDHKHRSVDLLQFDGVIYFDEIAQLLPNYPPLYTT